MPRGHEELDHTADLALAIWAEDETGLLEEAASALMEQMLGEGAAIDAAASRPVHIEAVDAEDRLVQWMNEVIYLAVTEGFLIARAELRLEASGLRGTLYGEESGADRLTSELKSATYHDLRIERGERGVRATVVIDV